MTITDTPNKFRYEGNASLDTFAFTGKAFTANDLIVEIITRATDVLVETLTLTTDYSVTIATNGTASIVVTNAAKRPTALQDIQIRRELAQTQTVALPSGTVFPASAVEAAIDRAVGLVQDLDEVVARSVKVPVTSSITDITLPPLPEDDKIIAWDGVAGAMKNSDTTLSVIEDSAVNAAASAAAALVSENNAAISETAAVAAAASLPSITATDTGSILQVNAAGTGYELLTAGTSGQVLTSNGVDSALSFEDAAGGAWVLLSTQTASASTSIDFTSGIDGTYNKYCIGIDGLIPASNSELYMRVSKSGVFQTGASDYAYVTAGNRTDGTVLNNSSAGAAFMRLNVDGHSASSTHGSQYFIYFTNPEETSSDKFFEWSGIVGRPTTGLTPVRGSGGYISTGAIDGIRFLMSTGNITSGTFKLYGIN